MAEDDDSDVDGAEDGKLMRLLEQAAFALEEGYGSVAIISNCDTAVRGGLGGRGWW